MYCILLSLSVLINAISHGTFHPFVSFHPYLLLNKCYKSLSVLYPSIPLRVLINATSRSTISLYSSLFLNKCYTSLCTVSLSLYPSLFLNKCYKSRHVRLALNEMRIGYQHRSTYFDKSSISTYRLH